MTPERWQVVCGIVQSAMELQGTERAAFLDSKCSDDPLLRKDVDHYLSIEGKLDPGFLEPPAAAQIKFPSESFASVSTLAAGARLGNYEVRALLGAGGMGQVYRARDLLLKREVAIKIIPRFYSSDSARLHRFRQEAEATAALNHPNILTVHQVGQEDTTFYIVAELLQGDTLRERLRGGPLPLRTATDYGVQIARGLAAAHESGVIHRDLKPENIFVTRDDRIKILDFGLAKLIEQPPERPASGEKTRSTQWTDPGSPLGTSAYMSPEQVRCGRVDYHSDIFAFGSVLYEMLTGRLAFAKATAAETMTAILNEDPPELTQSGRNISPGMQRVIQRCLEKRPEQRFQSAADLAFALEALSDSGSHAASAAERTATSSRPMWLAALVAAAIVLFTLLYLWWRLPPAAPVVESITQLTDDGEVKDQGAEIATDGPRVYFTEKYAGKFRLAQVAASGGPVNPVPTQIPAPYRATLIPDGSAMLVIENQYGRHPLWIQPLPAGDPRSIANLEAQDVAFTPDGKQFVYTDGGTINIADRNGSDPHRIANLPGIGYWPAVSPDGKKIRLTVATGDGAWLWEVGLDGNGLHKMAVEGKEVTNPAYGRWTPDGRYFVFTTFHADSRTDIWAISERPNSLQRFNPVPIQLTHLPFECSLPTPSLSGTQIFARCAKLRGELVRYDRGSQQFVPFLGGLSGTDLEYSRDGTWVVYLSYPDRSVWRMQSDGKDRLRLTYPPITAFYPHISPDGRRVVFSLRGHEPTGGLYLVNAVGGVPQKIFDGSIPDSPSWSPDGNHLAFDVVPRDMHSEQDATEIRVIDLRSRQVLLIPQSRGKCLQAWVNDDTLVATSDDGSKVFRYDFNMRGWTEIGNGPYQDCSSTDGQYVYCATMEPSLPMAVRIRVTDGQLERLADLTGLKRIVTFGSRELSLSPTGDLLFTHDIGTQEIYALTIRWP